MLYRFFCFLGAAAIATVALVPFSLAQSSSPSPSPSPAPANSWLDRPVTNWNQPGAAIPRATSTGDSDNPNCGRTVRPPSTANDRALVSAGWKLVGAVQVYNATSVVTAMTGFDGMCRPLGYQEFVFSGNTFAGTLSPRPMDSRSDGSSSQVFLTSETNLFAEFNRYKDSDALCCPSGGQSVSYEVRQMTGKPVVVPVQISPVQSNR